MNYSAKTLVHSLDQEFTDEYMIDFFVTGKQKLRGNGRRFVIGRRTSNQLSAPVMPRDGNGLPLLHLLSLDDVPYIKTQQGAFLTNDPDIIHKPQLRQGVYGTVLLRCKDGNKPNDSQATVMARGEVCGMISFADTDSQAKNTNAAAYHVVYADAFDPLIDAGYTIVQVPGEFVNDSTNFNGPPKNREGS